MDSRKFIGYLLKNYGFRLAIVFLLNLVSVFLAVFIFMMLEPFTQLLFRGEFTNLSPVSAFFISFLQRIIPLDEISVSVAWMILFAVVLFLVKNICAYFAQFVMASVRSHLIFSLRNQLYRKILTLPVSYFSSQKRGDVVSRSVNDTQEVEFTILTSVRQFMTEPVTALIFLVALFYISTTLTLYALLILPVTFLVIGRLSASLKKNARTLKQRLGSILSHVEETVAGLRIIKSSNAQVEAETVFHRLNDDFTRTQTKLYRKVDLASPLSEFLGVTVVMIVLIIGGQLVLSAYTPLSAELFITYIALFTQIINPLKNISTAFSNYKRGQAALERVCVILNATDSICVSDSPSPVSSFVDELRFDDVSFAYTDTPVLSNVSFVVKKGSTVALVGQSGAGKSTVADLIERFYDVDSGRILLDGKDIRQLDVVQYRNLFSLVSQDVVLFNDTLYNNIVMGMHGITVDDVRSALKLANLESFVDSLPDGIYHHLSDRGMNLSGGQRQRISIARAILHNTPILILDEATSAMDTESERLVQEALVKVMTNRTVVMIAHRLSTVRNADKIVVLDAGRVVEQGTHQELIENNGPYHKLVLIQQS